MAAVKSPRQAILNRVGDRAVLVITIIFLAPIYWIGSTAFKPRSLATTVPPTVFFQPEITLVHQALHQAGAAHQAGRSGGLRRGALVGAAHL